MGQLLLTGEPSMHLQDKVREAVAKSWANRAWVSEGQAAAPRCADAAAPAETTTRSLATVPDARNPALTGSTEAPSEPTSASGGAMVHLPAPPGLNNHLALSGSPGVQRSSCGTVVPLGVGHSSELRVQGLPLDPIVFATSFSEVALRCRKPE